MVSCLSVLTPEHWYVSRSAPPLTNPNNENRRPGHAGNRELAFPTNCLFGLRFPQARCAPLRVAHPPIIVGVTSKYYACIINKCHEYMQVIWVSIHLLQEENEYMLRVHGFLIWSQRCRTADHFQVLHIKSLTLVCSNLFPWTVFYKLRDTQIL